MKHYENIPIPAELTTVIDRAARRARRHRRGLRTGICAAAALCMLTVTANSPLAAQAVQLPILGPVVQLLHIGSGGLPTDGVAVHAQGQGGQADLLFSQAEGSVAQAPSFTVETYDAPRRVVITLGGVRFADRQAVCETLTQTEGVHDAYFAMLLDDSAVQLVVELADGYTYEVAERAEPAGLSLTFTPTEVEPATVYYLRTEAMPYGEALGHVAERFADSTQVRTVEGSFIVTVGQYATAEQAQQALDALNAAQGDTGLTIAGGPADAHPHDAV